MSTPQKFEFQTEIRQLLDIVIHSLYTEKEIFVRELVSNASDALEKLRHLQLVEKEIFDDRLPSEINITTDDKARTFTIQDFGIGMTRAELIENLGTIAHSGSKAFLKALSEGEAKNTSLIGQFGVGFYSAFMVAKRVQVYSHSWRTAEPGHVWQSDGSGEYTIEEAEGQRRGCKIVVELKDECTEFSLASKIEDILKRYSSFVPFPVNLNGKRVNTVQALWLRGKSEIKDEEYTEFYKFQANAFDTPRLRLHFSADAPLAINALLFVPEDNPERFGLVRSEPEVALYCRKILIDARPKDLLPEWLRFLRGVVDSEDLPLNISRETTQDRALIAKLSRVLTRRFIKFLEEEATVHADSYKEFQHAGDAGHIGGADVIGIFPLAKISLVLWQAEAALAKARDHLRGVLVVDLHVEVEADVQSQGLQAGDDRNQFLGARRSPQCCAQIWRQRLQSLAVDRGLVHAGCVEVADVLHHAPFWSAAPGRAYPGFP